MKFFFIIFLLILGCNDEQDEIAKISVTMLRVPYVTMSTSDWITPVYMYGKLESDNFDVNGVVVRWFSDTYWDSNDSGSFYQLLCGECSKGVWYREDGTTDTTVVQLRTLNRVTQHLSVTDSLGYFYNILTPIYPMRDIFIKSWWSIEETVIDSQEIFLMD